MAAVLAEGTTTIYNAACEPYVQQLCHMLVSMGAKISGIGSNLLTIEGVTRLGGAEHSILPDMIEVGSFIGMSAMVGDGVRICMAKHIDFVASVGFLGFRDADDDYCSYGEDGFGFHVSGNDLRFGINYRF